MEDLQPQIRIRKRIQNIFNKTESDFATKREYDDYLELREEYIFNLVEGENVAETEAKIQEYQRLNAKPAAIGDGPEAGHGVHGTGAVSDVAASQGYIPQGATMLRQTASSTPVPMHQNYKESSDGTLCYVNKGSSKRPTWRDVATASGWDSQTFFQKSLKEMFLSLV